MVHYIYDAWGNQKVLDAEGNEITEQSHIGRLNPFRYRGYHYDECTGLYYLKTRYYDPEIGRFVTIDGIEYADPETINGLNLYAYCGNNPVMNVDPTGTKKSKFWGWFWVGALASIAVLAIVAGTIAIRGVGGAILGGAGTGALIDMGTSLVLQGGFAKVDPKQLFLIGLRGAAIGAVSGLFSGVGMEIGKIVGQVGATWFSSATHLSSKIVFGRVFGATTMFKVGEFLGRITGGLLSGTIGNVLGQAMFGRVLNNKEASEAGLQGETISWIIDFLDWIRRKSKG